MISPKSINSRSDQQLWLRLGMIIFHHGGFSRQVNVVCGRHVYCGHTISIFYSHSPFLRISAVSVSVCFFIFISHYHQWHQQTDKQDHIIWVECRTVVQTFILNQSFIEINGSLSSIDQKVVMSLLFSIPLPSPLSVLIVNFSSLEITWMSSGSCL